MNTLKPILNRFDMFIDSYDSSPLYQRDVLVEEASAESWLKKGDEFFQQKRYDEALESYLNATDINPELPAAWYSMGEICQILGQQEEAETCFERARSEQQKANIEHIHINTPEIPQDIIVENPELPNLEDLEELYLIGINLSKNGQLDEALSTFEHVILFNPSDYRVWNSKGIALVKIGRHQEAYKAFNQALIINPSYQPAINNLNKLKKILAVPEPIKDEQSEESGASVNKEK
jgi:tetratricopeptide (TPR) repeat protein